MNYNGESKEPFLNRSSKMESKCFCCFTFIITLYITAVSSESLIASPKYPAVGDDVSLTLTPQRNITSGVWLLDGNILVFFYPPNGVMTDVKKRLHFNSSTSQLILYSVQVNDSGNYALQSMEPATKAEISLSVQEPITNASLTVSEPNLVEFNDSVTFNCTGTGTPLVFSWYNGSSEVTNADGRVITDGSSLIISNVTRYDSGPFSCLVKNNISNKTSPSISLNISYGPSNVTIEVLPKMMAYISGSNINLSCSCDSKPEALFQWHYNDSSLNVISPTYQITGATQNQTGTYTCIAQNKVTLRYSTATSIITISDGVSAASIVPVGEPPILNNSLTLICTFTGPADFVYWRKDNRSLFPDSRLSLSIQNNTLTFNQLALSDNGKYQCLANNTVSQVPSKVYDLIVNYGPSSTRIYGPDIADVGSNVTLNCSASSQPASQYSWFFQGSKVAEGTVYQADSLSFNSSGVYTCLAHNNITGRNSSAQFNLTVTMGISSVTVTPSTLKPLVSEDMQLFCNVTGNFKTIQWLKDSKPLNTTATNSISINDTRVDFHPLQITDDGSYQCVATNTFHPHESLPYKLIVNYGPLTLTITADIKSTTVLMCNAQSQPPSVYKWLFNGTVIKEEAKLVLPLKTSLGNNYTCMAINPLTNDTLSASYHISERNAAVPLQNSVLLTSLCALLLTVLMLMKPF